jgi:hypothetical protein
MGIEHVREGQQVELIGAAAVVQDEQATGLAAGRALVEGQRACHGVTPGR